MEENKQANWDLAARYLAGETDPGEEADFIQWLEEDASRQKEFRRMAAAWTYANQQPGQLAINEDRAWMKVKARISAQQHSTDPMHHRILQSTGFRVAASLLLLAVLALGIRLLTGNPEHAVHLLRAANSHTTPYMLTLPDSSVVTLNQGAVIEYAAVMKGSTREVKLEGEAFFEVKPDHARPFYVHTADANVRVVGTAFNVAAYKNSDEVRVVVESGTVELSDNRVSGNRIILQKGNYGTINHVTRQAVKGDNQDVNYLAWKTRVIRFDHTPLAEAVSVINHTYHINLVLTSPRLSRLPLTDTYTDESADTIIEVLSRVYKLEVRHNAGAIELSGK